MDVMTNSFPGMSLTGIGLVSPTGTGKHEFFRCLQEADVAGISNGGPHAYEPGQLLSRLGITEPKLRISRYLDPVSRNAIVAMRETLNDAGISEAQIAAAPHEYGVVLGTARGPCLTREALYGSLASRRGKMVSGTLFSHCGYNIAGAMTAIAYGLKGPNLTVAERGDLGVSVLRRAKQFLMKQRAHTVFAGVTECDGGARRRGVPFGEFAFLLCLERKDRAMKRGATVLAEVSVEDGEDGPPSANRFVVYGGHTEGDFDPENAAALSLALPGLPAGGERYLSLFLIGLLVDEAGLTRRYPAVTFTAPAGGTVAQVSLLHAQRECATV
jgi:hypothetical protein